MGKDNNGRYIPPKGKPSGSVYTYTRHVNSTLHKGENMNERNNSDNG